MRSDVYRGIAFRYMAAYGGYTALYLHRFCCASVGWTRGLTLPRAFSTAECMGAARRIRAARRSGRADGCGAGARLVASDAAEGSAWRSRLCKAGGGHAAEVASHPCASPHVSRRRWSASLPPGLDRAPGAHLSRRLRDAAPWLRQDRSATTMAELVPASGAGGVDECGTREWREAAARCVGPAASAVRAEDAIHRQSAAVPDRTGSAAPVKERSSVYAQLGQNDHNAQNVRVITYGR